MTNEAQTEEPLPAAMSEYERLSEEFHKVGGPVETYGPMIQDGIEIQAFATSKAGIILVGRSMIASRAALVAILDPNLPDKSVLLAVQELRVQHRLLKCIADTIADGKHAQRALALEEGMDLTGDRENPDQEDEEL